VLLRSIVGIHDELKQIFKCRGLAVDFLFDRRVFAQALAHPAENNDQTSLPALAQRQPGAALVSTSSLHDGWMTIRCWLAWLMARL
jgi:hypothetical protein